MGPEKGGATMKRKYRGTGRIVSLLSAAALMFSFALSNGTALQARADGAELQAKADKAELQAKANEAELQAKANGTVLQAKTGGVQYKGPAMEDGGQVTFYYEDTAGTAESVYVKGSWDSAWGEHFYMTKGGGNLWSVTTTLLEAGKTYEYGIMAGAAGSEEWVEGGDPQNPNTSGNSKIMGNPQINEDKSVTLFYYPDYGESYPADMKVLYRKSGSADAWTTAAMARDTVHTSAMSATFTPGTGTFEYKMEKGSTEISDKRAAGTQTFSVVDYPEEDPSVVSPVIEGTNVTFWYYGPGKSSAELAGSMNGWTGEAMTYDADSGYWSITKNLSAGAYEYKFILDGTWGTDPLNTQSSNGNSCFTVAEQTGVVSPAANAWGTTFNYYAPDASGVSVAGEMNGWDPAANPMVKDETSGYWTITLPLAAGNYEYKFSVDGSWKTDPLNASTQNTNSLASVAASGISPTVSGNSVTFVYPDAAKSESRVRLAGSMTGWQDQAEEFSYNSGKKQWELTKTISPGKYEYKFILGEDNWVNDPANEKVTSGGNNILWVSGLSDLSLQVEKGTAVSLPETVTYCGGDGRESQVKVTYELPAGLTGASISDNVITVDKSFAGDTIAVVIKASGCEAVLTVTPAEEIYQYTIYYYDKAHQTPDSSDLWIWENNGAPGAAFAFSGTEELSDGNTWLKAEMSLSYKELEIIARSKGEWSWQGPNVSYANTDKAKNVTLYLVADDGEAYTSLPEIREVKDRYVMIEYQRPAKDYTGWNLYTWDSGFGSEVTVNPTELNGKQVFIVPVKKQTKSLSFIIRRSEAGNDWAEKDGGDNNILIPAEQTVKKAIYTQNLGIAYIYPDNMGYELEPKQGRVAFYYRDDDLVLQDKLESLKGKVQAEADGKTFDMEYDKETDRFVCYDKNLTEGNHRYRYCVNGEYKLDPYNEKTEHNQYSVYTYKKYEAGITAQFSQTSVDPSMNTVLEIAVKKADDMEVDRISADLSVLGGSSDFAVDPQLMEGTVSVREDVKPDVYSIPVTITDQYGNEYTAKADLTVTEKTGDGTDWDEAVIYFMVTDRFLDGNSSNNQGVEKDNPSGYHGGDFAGVTQKLDYLQELGINTIWITPVVDNIEDALTTEVPGITSQAYHGYWAKDFTSLESRLGTEAEFKKLISEAHSRDIKIMVDVVLNHAGYNTEVPFGDMLRSSSDTVSGDAVLAPLSGLPDFATEKSEVRSKLVAWQTAWMQNYDIDYFRVDTVKHVEDTTWKAFKNSLTKANPEFKMIGEYSGAGYTFDGGQLGTGQMDSLLDFDFNDFGQRFVTGEVSQVESALESRNKAINNTEMLGSFLSSHDEDGLAYKLIQENGLTEEEALEKMLAAATLQITAKGQPVIYYGEEVGQYGANNYPYQTNRYDFDWSRVTKDNKILNHYKKLLSARNTYSDTFAKGERTNLAASDEEGYLVFERTYAGQHVVTALNITDKEQTLTFDLKQTAPDKIYTNLLTAGYGAGSRISGKKVTLTIPPVSEGGTYMFSYRDKKKQEETPKDDPDTTDEKDDTPDTQNPNGPEDTPDTQNPNGPEDTPDTQNPNEPEDATNSNLENSRIKTGDEMDAAGAVLVLLGAAAVLARIRRRKSFGKIGSGY